MKFVGEYLKVSRLNPIVVVVIVCEPILAHIFVRVVHAARYRLDLYYPCDSTYRLNSTVVLLRSFICLTIIPMLGLSECEGFPAGAGGMSGRRRR